MRTFTSRLCAVIAALLLTLGLARAADLFDPLASEISEGSDSAPACSTPPCIDPPDRMGD